MLVLLSGHGRNPNLIVGSNVSCHRLQNPWTIKLFWCLGNITEHSVNSHLHLPLSLPFGSPISRLENYTRYASLRLFNPFLLALLRVIFVVLPDVLSTTGVRTSEKGLPKYFLVRPSILAELAIGK